MDGQLEIKMFKMSDECLEKPVLCMENPQNSIWPKPPVAALQTAMALVPSHTEITSGQISWHQGPKGRSAVGLETLGRRYCISSPGLLS